MSNYSPKTVLHPIISSIQKIAVYETKTKLYIVGSNNSESCFRLLTIDRTRPKTELHIVDDGVEYRKEEVENLSFRTDGARIMTKPVSAFGILGFVRFLEGYYMILVTKRSRIAVIGLHSVYKIEDIQLMYVVNESLKGLHPDEARYVKMFNNIDLSSNFYYSYSYDITHSLQINMAIPINLTPGSSTPSSQENNLENDCYRERPNSANGSRNFGLSSSQCSDFAVRSKPNWKFVWNTHLLAPIQDNIHPDWIIYIIHGFVCQSNISIFGRSVHLTLIARRSKKYAGTRFLKRGANFAGDVGNEVESEQIVQDMGVTNQDFPRLSSFVQMRGSIPGHWSQVVTKIVPKPTIAYDLSDPYVETAGRHFNDLLRRYGSPIIVLNLVKQRESKKHESILSEQFSLDIKYLNLFLPPQHSIQYVSFDMARKNKGKVARVMSRLGAIAESAIEKTGLYVSHLNLLQTGVIRVNCVDCLDRTNTAQFALGRCALALQLKSLGLLGESELQFDCDCTRLLEALYEDHGDTLAVQYGGSQLVHRIKTYRKTAPWTSQGNDIMQTLSRYYRNTFSDQEKQHTINLFLGLYVPYNEVLPIWEMPTDYFMHNPQQLLPVEHNFRRNPLTQWWSESTLKALPLSSDLVNKTAQESIKLIDRQVEWVDAFADFHKIHEVTSLIEVNSFITSHSVRDFMPHFVTNFSPFIVRGRPGRRREDSQKGPNTKNPSLTGLSSTSSTTSSASSSQESEEEETKLSSHQSSPAKQSSDSYNCFGLRSSLPTRRVTYDTTLSKPSRADNLTYKRYVLIHQVATRSLVQSSLPTRAFTMANTRKPISKFSGDSSYEVAVPKVKTESMKLYEEYATKHESFRDWITPTNIEKLARYVNNELDLFTVTGWEDRFQHVHV